MLNYTKQESLQENVCNNAKIFLRFSYGVWHKPQPTLGSFTDSNVLLQLALILIRFLNQDLLIKVVNTRLGQLLFRCMLGTGQVSHNKEVHSALSFGLIKPRHSSKFRPR